MSSLQLVSPLRGFLTALSEVPDEVFAQRMLGDGVAIEPIEGVLTSPCDGTVLSIAKTKHAITLRATNGAEILMHIGLDTVALEGEGFVVHVTEGENVTASAVLIEFDVDKLSQRAKSLITPIVVTNSDAFTLEIGAVDRSVCPGDSVFAIQPTTKSVAAGSPTEAAEVSISLRVQHDHGLHARPAAVIASTAKQFSADIFLGLRGKRVNAKSAVSLMSLGARQGDEVALTAAGADAQDALTRVAALIGVTQQPPAFSAPAPSAATPMSDGSLKGVIASRGYAIGCAAHLKAPEIVVTTAGRGVAFESAEFERARSEVKLRLQTLAQTAGATACTVLSAHIEFLDDWELVAAAKRWIARGKSAGYAWRQAVRDSADTLKALGDARMAERVDDLRDLESQVLLALTGQLSKATRVLPERAIVIADELKPSQLVALDASRIAGICTAAGGATSHVAILAASMGVPALAALGDELLSIAEGEALIVDAEAGLLTLIDSDEALRRAEENLAARVQRRMREQARAQEESRTLDGVRIEVFANLGSVSDAQLAVSCGAEGCGLLRTEFLFLDRSSAPDEHEQVKQYQAIARTLGNRPLTLRTLDIGGDKALPYLPLPPEQNPALGLRGVRTSLWRPDLLRTQLRAVLRVHATHPLRVLLPMISDLSEVSTVREIMSELSRELGLNALPALGVMIETPASALIATQLAREVDFFSIGTNDLTQYTLAMDREHSDLAARTDGLHPAVLRLIATTVEGAAKYERPVAVCGGLASDPLAAPILIGLGAHELSVVPTLIPQLKATIRGVSSDVCSRLARQALDARSADDVRVIAAQLQPTLETV